jgi:hypothetical protein
VQVVTGGEDLHFDPLDRLFLNRLTLRRLCQKAPYNLIADCTLKLKNVGRDQCSKICLGVLDKGGRMRCPSRWRGRLPFRRATSLGNRLLA